jgi:UDP-N-acetylglucosamine 2-epimerase (non-hydrolysing)
MKKILIVAGTRPEAIKLAPVYLGLKKRGINVNYLHTGQHAELHDQVMDFFGIDFLKGQSLSQKPRDLSDLCSKLTSTINNHVKDDRYTHVIVQGDTASAFCAANVAFFNKVPVFHVEAGLRSGSVGEPFPEEALRRMISVTAEAHFCPTLGAYENLINERIDRKKIYITGNTVVDAVRLAKEINTNKIALSSELGKDLFSTLSLNSFILVTIHRRENHGARLDQICDALISFSRQSDTHVLCPVHPNPEVRIRLTEKLSFEDKIHLIPALSYPSMMWAIKSCKFIVSDSGGLQEEAPSFQKRILILRDQTERPEVVTAGWGELIGTNTDKVANAICKLDKGFTRALPASANPFGDGFASDMICEVLMKL